MFNKTILILTLLVATVLGTTSCKTSNAISTPDGLKNILKTIPVGESRYVEIEGLLRPYSGKFPKGMGSWEISVGGTDLLIHATTPQLMELVPFLNKQVSATVKISNFPLKDSNPASQIQGHWITEIKDLISQPGIENDVEVVYGDPNLGSDVPQGSLGYPMGTYLTIEGVRNDDVKGSSGTLLVDKIQGIGLKKPISIWIDNLGSKGLPKGKRCILRGYESGAMVGIPYNVAEKENMPMAQVRFHFRKFFIITSVVGPKTLKTR